MSNYEGNERIAEYGKATRFGAGMSCPRTAQQKASRPWEIKNALRAIMIAEFDINEPLTFTRLLRVFGDETKQLTGAQILAAKLTFDALDNWYAMDRLIWRLEGKP
jgi:hypothetical protein